MLLILSLVISLARLHTQSVAPSTSAVRDAKVTRVIDNFAEAWSRHDVPAMMALHTDGFNFTNIAGQWWRGKQEVAEGLQEVHATVFAKSTMTLYSDQVRFLGDSTAVYTAHGAAQRNLKSDTTKLLLNLLPATRKLQHKKPAKRT